MHYKKNNKKISLGISPTNRITQISKAKKYVLYSNVIFVVGFVLLGVVFYFARPFNLVSENNIDIVKPFSGTVLGLVYNASTTKFSFNELSSKSVSIIRPVDTPKKFLLSIPKLNIDDAVTIVDDKTLTPDDALGHYTGTALPGEVGNSFIYGHSSLPFFYNPKDYKTIFTKIPDLKNGDKIYIRIANKKLVYSVKLGRELLPKEIDPYISYYPAGFNKSTITLMTCTPPGTKNYRYIVVAELEKSVLVEN